MPCLRLNRRRVGAIAPLRGFSGVGDSRVDAFEERVDFGLAGLGSLAADEIGEGTLETNSGLVEAIDPHGGEAAGAGLEETFDDFDFALA